jgi:hypothetical protein
VAIDNTTPPKISGTAEVGSKLTTTSGEWKLDNGNAATNATYKYSWRRCNSTGGSCATIVGAETASYVLTKDDVGDTIRSAVTATSGSESGSATSEASDVVKASGGSGEPNNTAKPTIAGSPQVGETLTASPGTWTGTTPIDYSYAWLRCDSNAGNCKTVSGATGKTLALTSTDLDSRIKVIVSASNSAGRGEATSDATAAVTSKGSSGNSVDVSDLPSTERLTPDPVAFSPTKITREPFTMRVHVVDLKGRSVKGALVYVTGTPFNLIKTAPEVTSKGDGWATLTLVPTSSLPVGKGAALQLFVRVRREGDDILAGISGRRLVQVKIQ